MRRRRHNGGPAAVAFSGHGWRRRRARGRICTVAAGEPVCRTSVLAFVEVALHVPPPTKRLPARRAAVCTAMNVTMVLKRTFVSASEERIEFKIELILEQLLR